MQNFLSDYPCVRVAQKLKGAFVRPKIRRKSIPVFFYDIAGFFFFSWNNHILYFQMKRNIAIFIIILMMVMVTAPIEAHYLYVPKKKTWLETKFDNFIEVCMYYVSDDKLRCVTKWLFNLQRPKFVLLEFCISGTGLGSIHIRRKIFR